MNDELTQLGRDLDHLTLDVLLVKVRSAGIIERVRAIAALARTNSYGILVTETLFQVIRDPINRNARTMGTISVAHFGVACLLKFGSDQGRQQIKQLIDVWEEPDRSDLKWFLRSQAIDIPE
jgi:hypothetical protein